MNQKTRFTDEEVLQDPPDGEVVVHTHDDIADLEAAVAAARDAADPVAAQHRIDAEVIDAADRAIPWDLIVTGLGTDDPRAAREKYAPRIEVLDGLTYEEVLRAFREAPEDQLVVHHRDEIADLEAAVAAARDADDPAAALERIDTEAVDAARRGVPWLSIAIGMGTYDVRGVRERYAPLV